MASDHSLVQPLYKTGFFITNKDYNTYDTLATVEQLDKSVSHDKMMTEEEILTLRGNLNPDNEQISKPSRKFKKRKRSA